MRSYSKGIESVHQGFSEYAHTGRTLKRVDLQRNIKAKKGGRHTLPSHVNTSRAKSNVEKSERLADPPEALAIPL